MGLLQLRVPAMRAAHNWDSVSSEKNQVSGV